MAEAANIDPKDIRQRLKDDFEFFARNCLTIKTKVDGNQPLVLNKAQKHIHDCIEKQLAETGRVRVVLLKGRQQGGSTVVEGRFNWKLIHNKSLEAYILTHEDKATQNLFAMSKRFYDHLPVHVKPARGKDNANELTFCDLESGIRVGTAGNKAVGRSMTNQFFHGSEVAFWPNAAEHAKGILQTIPDQDGTEVIYESTANGLGNFFHQQWKMAESGESEFIPVFVPWYWQDEYRKELPENFSMTKEEVKLQEQYDLDEYQIYWRRQKIISLSADGTDGGKSFKQEYPMNAAEAFQVTGADGLITADVVARARVNKVVTPTGPLIVGVDPSRGGDRFSIIKRCGRKAYDKESYVGTEINTLGKMVSKCVKVLDTHCYVAGKKPDMMFVDAGGGADLVDRLHELGYEDRVKAIWFGGQAINDDKYPNKRCEMWGVANLWLRDENYQVDIPDDDVLQADLCASPYDEDSNNRIVLWKKEKIKKEYGFSPDEGDAFALTFAEPVKANRDRNEANVNSGSKSSSRFHGGSGNTNPQVNR